jgi:hypothetical protein
MISEYEIGRYGWLIQVKLAAAAKKLGGTGQIGRYTRDFVRAR